MEWTAPSAWNPQFWALSPMLENLRPAAHSLEGPDWPSLDDYNRLLQQAPHPILTRDGVPIRFVPQGPKPTQFDEEYEPRITLKGEVQTRTENWHDLFNALAWLTFPETKAVLNRQHYRATAGRSVAEGAKNRGTARDVLTLFDESGVIVACADNSLAERLIRHQWKDLFWQQRAAVRSRMRFFLFGHSLQEKALKPYIGLTGKGLILPVTEAFLALSQPEQLARLDQMLAAHFSGTGSLQSTAPLCPVPLLGVPGWWPDNEEEGFYDNSRYFRPAKTTTPGTTPSPAEPQ